MAQVLEERRQADAATSYTARLLASGLPRIAQKVGEEAVETVIASLSSEPDDRGALVEEGADLLYHLLVLLMACGVAPSRLAAELQSRHAGGTKP